MPHVKHETIKNIYRGSTEISVDCLGGQYFINRKFKQIPKRIRLKRKMYERDSKEKMPALLAALVSRYGEAVGCQVTYLSISGGTAMIKHPRIILKCDDSDGADIRLYEPDFQMHSIGLCLTIEDAMAVKTLYDVPCWVAPSRKYMEEFEPPSGIKLVQIYSRNSADFAFEKSAYCLAHKLEKGGVLASVSFPSKDPGTFYNEFLLAGGYQCQA